MIFYSKLFPKMSRRAMYRNDVIYWFSFVNYSISIFLFCQFDHLTKTWNYWFLHVFNENNNKKEINNTTKSYVFTYDCYKIVMYIYENKTEEQKIKRTTNDSDRRLNSRRCGRCRYYWLCDITRWKVEIGLTMRQRKDTNITSVTIFLHQVITRSVSFPATHNTPIERLLLNSSAHLVACIWYAIKLRVPIGTFSFLVLVCVPFCLIFISHYLSPWA